MGRSTCLACVLALCAAACGGKSNGNNGDGGPGDGQGTGTGAIDAGVMCLSGLQSITLSPSQTTITITTAAPPSPITFTASGHYADGHDAAIDASLLAWKATRADQTDPGMISAGVYTPNPAAGGHIQITATDGCITSGPAAVDITLDATVGTPNGDWSGPVVTTGAPLIVYPSDQTRFPRNIYRTLFQWRKNTWTTFRLTFTGPSSTTTVYTDGAHADCAAATPPAGCWEADQTAWSYIAASNAGATATWTVDALDTSTTPPTIHRAGPITIGFSKQDVKGAIFYWSTTSAGVRRAAVSAQYPEDYIAGNPSTVYTGTPSTTVKCVACHVVSHDGKYLAAPVQSGLGQSVWITQVTMLAPPTPLVTAIANTMGHGFATISPDDAHVIVAFGGKLWMVDRVTGTKEQDVPLGGVMGTHPDWSPAANTIAFAGASGDAPGNAPLDTIAWQGGTSWSAIKTLVPAAGQSNLFPSFSPDGNWIAYVRGKGGHDDKTAQLWIIDKDGTMTPVELKNANRVVSNGTTTDTLGQHQNSQPTWGPTGDYAWIAFNSMRAYGVVRPSGGVQQIWVAAIDPSKLGTGVDPSFPAFRIQFQGLDENNHRAYWTEDVRDNPPPPPPPTDGGVCVAHGMTCVPGQSTCCDSGDVCDTTDNGQTYSCMVIVN
jgi:hypothetical protein